MAAESTLRYLKLDYQAHKDALLQRIRDRWSTSWNDFLSNSIGIVIVDIVAWGFATLAYTLNRIGGECFIPTMTLRESAVRLGALTGYQLQNPVSAVVSCEATLSSATTATVTIPKGTQIRTSDSTGIPFEVAKDYTIDIGDLTPKTLIVTFTPALTGANIINSFVSVTEGSVNADCVDSTVDLSQYIQTGQTFNKTGDTTSYIIQALETAPGAVSAYSRLVLDRAYEGTTEAIEAEVYDKRIQLVQGQTIVDKFVASDGDTSNFSVKLSQAPVVDGSVVVTVNDVEWQEIISTGLREPEDQVFQVKTATTGVTLVAFGDDSFGAAVPPESSITVSYRVGGGSAGNIALNAINTSITGLVGSTSNPISILVSNATSTGIGGREAETLEQARISIPVYTRTNDRAVTLEDYQTLAQQFVDAQMGAVAYARASTRNENSFLEGNIVAVYAWTTGTDGGLVPLNSQLKQALEMYLQSKAVGTDLAKVYDGTSRPVPISLRFKTKQGFNISSTKQLVTDTIKNFINVLKPGDPILYSNLLASLDAVYGVDTVNMATPIADLSPSSDLELFTVPQDSYAYALQRVGAGSPQTDANGDSVSPYTVQLPIYPLAAWSFQLFLGSTELTILPDVDAGFARVLGTNLSSDSSSTFWSRVDLLTGQCTFWIKGAPGDLTMKLITVQGYSAERLVNIYVGYTGENTVSKRSEIRSALRAWGYGLPIGGSIYASQQSSISASTVSVEDVVARISGVTEVTRVALDSPASSAVRVTAADYELLKLGNCYLNNSVS